jgi:hypothetical protein
MLALVTALIMETSSTSETSASYQTIWRNNPEDRSLSTRRRVNLEDKF